MNDFDEAAVRHALNVVKHDETDLAAMQRRVTELTQRFEETVADALDAVARDMSAVTAPIGTSKVAKSLRRWPTRSMTDGPDGNGLGGLCDRDAS